MYMYVRHVITRRKPIAACAEIAIFLAICEEIAFLPCPNTAKIRHGQGRLEHFPRFIVREAARLGKNTSQKST